MLRIGKRMLSWNSTKAKIAGQSTEKLTAFDFSEKIADELVYGNRRDGTPFDATAGEWQPENAKLKMLADEWFGVDAVRVGYVGLLSLGKTVGLSDTEFDMQFQFFEEVVGGASGPSGPGTVTLYFPRNRVVNPHGGWARGVGGAEVDVEIRVVDPPQGNGVQLASLLRSFSGLGAGF